MRKVTRESVNSFNNNVNFKSSNTEVVVTENSTKLVLHRNVIGIKNRKTGVVSVSTCGWNTPTTKERLNGLEGVRVNTKNFELFLNGKSWNGKLTEIK
jgi:hypothetical protein